MSIVILAIAKPFEVCNPFDKILYKLPVLVGYSVYCTDSLRVFKCVFVCFNCGQPNSENDFTGQVETCDEYSVMSVHEYNWRIKEACKLKKCVNRPGENAEFLYYSVLYFYICMRFHI